ncbi:MAG TPA: hypothetical protein PKD16_10490 [Saprospiraceae bacterium]|jgi:hypothetical protein|nr:hypothetical protein [Saprospiraceae bacterium]HMT70580.1 hypothetical protein [Saprospiraceae bacterium]
MKTFSYFIFGIIFILACKSTKTLDYTESDLKWKKDAMLEISKRFVDYINIRPRDSIHNYELDMYNKFIDIERYPFGIGIKNIKKEVENKKIRFDSIVCVTTQIIGIDPSMIYENLYFIFEKGSVKSLYEFYPESYKIRKPEMDILEVNNSYKYHISQVDGDNMSLLIFTTFKPNWEYKISKITINYFPKFE